MRNINTNVKECRVVLLLFELYMSLNINKDREREREREEYFKNREKLWKFLHN